MKNKIKKASQYVFAREKEKKETPSPLAVFMEKHIKQCEKAAEKTIFVPVADMFPFLK